MKNFTLIESHVYDLKEENGIYIAKVYLEVRFKDYVENVNTGIITRGSINNKVCNTYILTFICTKEKSHNINECPNCGAEVKGNATGTCEYCKSKLINKKYNWIMSLSFMLNPPDFFPYTYIDNFYTKILHFPRLSFQLVSN